MKIIFKLVNKKLLTTVMVAGSFLSIGLVSGTASALEQQNSRALSPSTEHGYSQQVYRQPTISQNGSSVDSIVYSDPASEFGHGLRSPGEPQPPAFNPRWAQGDGEKFRSKGSVIKEVKQRYNARVLKISLNKQRAVYNVRVLMPSGKVRNIQVRATR